MTTIRREARAEQTRWANTHTKVKREIVGLKGNITIKEGVAISSTGKDVSHLVEVVMKRTPNQVRASAALGEMGKHEEENGGFVFAFFNQAETMDGRFPTLNKPDLARLMVVGTYVGYDTNRLQSDNGRIVKREALIKTLAITPKLYSALYKRYEAEGILTEDKNTGEIFVNPSVFARGKIKKTGCSLEYVRMYRKTVRELYAQYSGRKLGQLALVYSLLPFLNFNTNILAYNPEETDSDLLRPLNITKLALLLDYSDSHKLKTAMNGIKVDGKYVFNFVEEVDDRRERQIIVNPRIIYGGNGANLEAIKALF